MRLAVLVLAVLGLSLPADAQAGFMPYAGYNVDDEDFLIGVGARFALPLHASVAVVAQPSIEYQFSRESLGFVQTDLNVAVELTAWTAVAPYVGAGVGLTYLSVSSRPESEVGANALAGLVVNASGFGRPFVQVRYGTRGDFPDAFSVQGGVILSL